MEINSSIRRLRAALNDSADRPRFTKLPEVELPVCFSTRDREQCKRVLEPLLPRPETSMIVVKYFSVRLNQLSVITSIFPRPNASHPKLCSRTPHWWESLQYVS